jgi:hypothetical protein
MSHTHESPPTSAELIIPSSLSLLSPYIVDDLIRVGRENDGGYVIPKSLIAETRVLVSLGVSDDWSFDQHFKKLNPKIHIHAYDYTISKTVFRNRIAFGLIKLLTLKAPFGSLTHRINTFRSYNKFFTGKARHFEERIHNRIDRVYDVTLDRVFERTGSEHNFLKIDIEGSEYRIINDVVKHADKIVGMVIEFHDTDPLRAVFVEAIRTLQERFEIVHLHANNCGPVAGDGLPEVLELTFIKRSTRTTGERRITLPIPMLDSANDPNEVDYRMRFKF